VSDQLYPAPISNPDNSGKAQRAYVLKIAEMSNEDLGRECGSMIYMSAFAANNPRSCYHWQCDACYDECKRRKREDIYSEAHKGMMRSQGYGS
jgi:hypothetical protein